MAEIKNERDKGGENNIIQNIISLCLHGSMHLRPRKKKLNSSLLLLLELYCPGMYLNHRLIMYFTKLEHFNNAGSEHECNILLVLLHSLLESSVIKCKLLVFNLCYLEAIVLYYLNIRE